MPIEIQKIENELGTTYKRHKEKPGPKPKEKPPEQPKRPRGRPIVPKPPKVDKRRTRPVYVDKHGKVQSRAKHGFHMPKAVHDFMRRNWDALEDYFARQAGLIPQSEWEEPDSSLPK